MSPDKQTEQLVLRIADLCDPPEAWPEHVVDQCSALVSELCDLLNNKRKPPACDLRAAIAYGYALMLMQAIQVRDARMARLEPVGIYDQILAGPTAS